MRTGRRILCASKGRCGGCTVKKEGAQRRSLLLHFFRSLFFLPRLSPSLAALPSSLSQFVRPPFSVTPPRHHLVSIYSSFRFSRPSSVTQQPTRGMAVGAQAVAEAVGGPGLGCACAVRAEREGAAAGPSLRLLPLAPLIPSPTCPRLGAGEAELRRRGGCCIVVQAQ